MIKKNYYHKSYCPMPISTFIITILVKAGLREGNLDVWCNSLKKSSGDIIQHLKIFFNGGGDSSCKNDDSDDDDKFFVSV